MEGRFSGVMATVLICNILVNEFKFQSLSYVHFQTNNIAEAEYHLGPSYESNVTTIFLL